MVNTESKSTLKENSNALNNWFLDKAKNIEITSMLITNTSMGDLSTHYLQHYKNDSDIIDMYIGLPGKKFIDGSGWIPLADFDPTTRQWYKNAVEKKALVFSDPYIDAQTNEIIITPSIQLTNSKGEVTGVLAADNFLTTLMQKVSEEVLASVQNMVKAINEITAATNEGAGGTAIITQKMASVEEKAGEVLKVAEVAQNNSRKLINLVARFKI